MYTLYDKTQEIRSPNQVYKASRRAEKYERKLQSPAYPPLSDFVPAIALQMEVAAAEGAKINVVPVSMAANFALPILTVMPFRVTPEHGGACVNHTTALP
jgi:hypothetical protein